MGADQEQLWVVQARAGDQEAFAKIVTAYQMPIYSLAYRMLGSSADAEDATQETFLRAYAALGSYDPRRKLSSWILSIASHYCVDRLRRQHGRVPASLDDEGAYRWIPDERPKPEEQMLAHEQSAAIHCLLRQLPPQYRLVIVLRYWHDLSYDEIAEMTQTTESAVKSRLHRAREMMADRLAESPAPQAEKAHNPGRMPEHAMCRSY